MQIFKKKEALQTAVSKLKSQGKTLGLVPTMGALHEGHLSLVQNAEKICDQVVVSIFVNPTQFNNPQDLEKYPRGLQKDIDLLETLNPNLWVFAPTAYELYGENVISEEFDFGSLGEVMEGKFRAGHFDGVGTVVKMLFEIVKPHKAFFGQKDYQQLQVIRKLTKDENLPVEVIGCPILREANGLARSSRNELLNPTQRENAAFIHQTLLKSRDLFGTKSVNYITDWVNAQFENHPFLKLEYFEIAEASSLKKINRKRKGQDYRAFIAAYAGEVRLIDNIALN
ncbi:MAG: pantoate--beta-alanine ligase [Salegentibacter sp.]|uniref:Pantothenate synthetase n=1 Tax=Salegentibacter flavus TaxID=287099 RepID=A0A1I4XKP1_9FLAO|nr:MULTISPECIES: pantoate--beta-alanine ligase [Salegentibacter]MDR9455960.1 pantoate--beta-alanine ligase [Salegentibacter sp.]SFN25829.1 pantothenate synthetase [Salegentibacter flavus]